MVPYLERQIAYCIFLYQDELDINYEGRKYMTSSSSTFSSTNSIQLRSKVHIHFRIILTDLLVVFSYVSTERKKHLYFGDFFQQTRPK